MPIIILCGLPCSGKSRRSLELQEYFENTKHLRTIIVSEHDSGLQRNFLYSGIVDLLCAVHQILGVTNHRTCVKHRFVLCIKKTELTYCNMKNRYTLR